MLIGPALNWSKAKKYIFSCFTSIFYNFGLLCTLAAYICLSLEMKEMNEESFSTGKMVEMTRKISKMKDI